MYFKFKLVSPIDTGNPDYDICNQGLSVLTPTNELSLDIMIDDYHSILGDIRGYLSGGYNTNPNATTTNGFQVENINISSTGTGEVSLKVNGVTPYKPCNITLIISSNTNEFLTYTQTFKIFGEDVTDDVLSGSFNIVMIKQANNVVSGYQTKPFVSFVGYRQPFTDKLYLYKTDSSQGSHQYYDSNNLLLSSTDCFLCVENTIDIKCINTLNNNSLCQSSTQTFYSRVDIPLFESSIATNINGSDDETIIIDNNTIQTNIDTSVLYKGYLNGVLSTFAQYANISFIPTYHIYLKYSLYDYAGTLYWESDEIDLNINTFTTDQTIKTFGVPTFGDFVIKTELYYSQDGVDIFKAYKSYNIVGNLFSEITRTDCSSYLINNYSLTDCTLIISKLQDIATWTDISTTVVPSLSKIPVTLDEDSVYKFSIAKNLDGSTPLVYIVINDCSLQTCLMSYLKKLMCCEPDECQKQDTYNFMSLILNSTAYFNLVMQEYKLNFVYTSLNNTKMSDLYSIQTFLDRCKEYCVECQCTCKGTTTLGKNCNCGCS